MLLLYILAFPKVAAESYRLMHLYATISEGKGDCLSIDNTTVCREEEPQKLEEATCIPRLLKGSKTKCSYHRKNQLVVKQVDDEMLYLTDFNNSTMRR